LLVVPLIGFAVLTTSGTEPLAKLNDFSVSVERLTEPQKKQNKNRKTSTQVTAEVRKPTFKKRKTSKSSPIYQYPVTDVDTLHEAAASGKSSVVGFRKTNFNLRPTLDTTLGNSMKEDAGINSKYRYPVKLPSSPVRLIPSANNPSKN
jgi:hypothetical protein